MRMKLSRLSFLLFLSYPVLVKSNARCQQHSDSVNGTVYQLSDYFWPLKWKTLIEDIKNCGPISQASSGITNVLGKETEENRYGIKIPTSISLELGSYSSLCMTSISLCVEGLSISFWLKPYDTVDSTEPNKVHHILGTNAFMVTKSHDKANGLDGITAQIKTLTGKVSVDTIIEYNAWSHIGVIWANGVLKLYVDGLKVNESRSMISISIWLTTQSSLYLSRSPLFTQSSAVEGHNMYSDVAVWYRGLSDEQMYEAYHILPRCTYLNPSSLNFSSTTSSHFNYRAENAPTAKADKAWCAKENENGTFLQIKFAKLTKVCTIKVYGFINGSMVTKFKISSSADGVKWSTDSKAHENYRKAANFRLELPRPLEARYLRLYPVSWIVKPCMQVSFFGLQIENVNVRVVTEGFSDPGVSKRTPTCSIKVNNVEHCKGGNGHNIVVIEPSTGHVTSSRNFDTSSNTTAAKEMADYLTSIDERFILVVAVKGSGHRYINDSAEALYRIGAVDPLVSCENCSWTLIGRNGSRKSWVQQVSRRSGMGPAKIEVDIPLEENNHPKHWWRLDKVVWGNIVDARTKVGTRLNGKIAYNRLQHSFRATRPLQSTSCLLDPDKCLGGLTIAFWMHQSKYSLSKALFNPSFIALENEKAKCFTWLTDKNRCCVFPFVYDGATYTSCTEFRHHRLWCSLTPILDDDNWEWGNCLGCNRPLLKPMMFSASSTLSGYGAMYAAFSKTNSFWSPNADDGWPYLQADIEEIIFLTAIATRGGTLNGVDHWVKSFQLWYSFAGIAWRIYKEGFIYKDFIANWDVNTIVTNQLQDPIKIRSVRIVPLMHTGKIALKLELYGCPEDDHPLQTMEPTTIPEDCDFPLGLENGKIADKQLSVSTANTGYFSKNVRLNGPKCWVPSLLDDKQFLMITFVDKVFLTAVATQGSSFEGKTMFVSSYWICSSHDSHEWIDYMQDGQPKIFSANSDANTVVKNTIKYPFDKRYLRIYPKTWATSGIALRAEVYGCLKENPKFSIVGPVFNKRINVANGQTFTVSYKYCTEGLSCPTCKRQLYVSLPALKCIGDVHYVCNYTEFNVSMPTSRYTLDYESIKVFEVIGSGCPIPLVLPNPADIQKMEIIGHTSRASGARSCYHYFIYGNTKSGYYGINSVYGKAKTVYCDMKTHGGGWTVIQKRFNGSVNFFRDWYSYVEGFGSLDGEYWIGNIFARANMLSTGTGSELRIELETYTGEKGVGHYESFYLFGFTDNFKLQVSGFEGNIGDSLSALNGVPFSTWDKDTPNLKCSNKTHSGWWNNDTGTECNTPSNLNGKYDSMTWQSWKGSQSLKKSEMKVRPSKAVKCNEWACYYAIDGNSVFNYASTNCEKFGATLTSITSVEEFEFIKEFLNLQTTPPQRVTIGLQFKDGQLTWTDGSEYKYEANSVNTSAANCFILEKDGIDYKWTHFGYKPESTDLSICKRGITCHQADCFYDFTRISKGCSDHENFCAKHNSKMTKIYNRKKDQFITKHMKNGVRTGLSDLDGVTKWKDNTSPSYENWNPSSAQRSPFCTTQYSDGWKKEDPSDIRPVLCEKPLSTITTPESCSKLLQYGVTENGIYALGNTFVYCDQENDGGGWIVIQRRNNSLENFNRTLLEYQNGFGNKMESFWLGNGAIASFVSTASRYRTRMTLLVNFVLANGSKYYAFYENFKVSHLDNKYYLQVSGYKGTAGDYLSYNDKMFFSTYDKDNDKSLTQDCAKKYGSGWWFNNCSLANLNAEYDKNSVDTFHIYWGPLRSISYVEMKIKAVSFPVTRSFLKTEGPNRKGFSITDVGNKKKVVVRTSDRDWELLFTPTLFTWVHVCITWSPANGLRYYEDGRLTASNDKYKLANNTLIGTSMQLGYDQAVDRTTILKSVKRLGLWFSELQPYAIQDVYNYANFTFDNGFECWAKPTDRHHTVPDPYRVWKRNSGCTPSVGTGPCADHTIGNPLGSYIYVEASLPHPSGNFSVITSPHLLPVYRCLRFMYHMRGTGQGRLHVAVLSKTPYDGILWSAAQNNRKDWQKAQVALRDPPSKISFFGRKNKNFESDFAIDDVSLDTKPCTTDYGCNPPCIKGTSCNILTKTCNCGKRTNVDESCRSVLHKTAFVDAAHYWAFEDHTFIEDSLGNKNGILSGSVESIAQGAHNFAVQLKGQPSWISFGDFSKECLGDFSSCENGLTLTFWLKHFIKVGVAMKQKFLTLGNVADGERGFAFGFDPAVQEDEFPIISVRVNLPDKYCQYKIPVPSSVWSHFGFSIEYTYKLSVYRNGKLVDTGESQPCTSYANAIPASAVLLGSSPTQAAHFQLDELVIWNKWLEQKDYINRFRYASTGFEQKVNLLLKLTNEVWNKDLSDLESEAAMNLTEKIIQSFQAMFVKRSCNGRPVKVIIHGFSEGSVNVNTTLLFESLTYNDTLLLERWLFEQKALNTIPVSVMGISSSTVPDIYPKITTKGKNVTAIYVNWTIGDYTSVYQLFQGCRILYRRTDEPNSTFMVHNAIGTDNYTIVPNAISGVNYTMRLLLFTLSGDGLISPVFYATTLEYVPSETPGNPSGINTSSTTLNFTWTHIAAKNWRGIPLGYRIKYWPPEVSWDPVLNITVAPDTDITEIGSLRKYMIYCMTVAAFNSAGDGNYSVPVCIRTEEDVPDAPLDDIQTKNISAFEIQLTSTGVPFINRNGIITKYVLIWTSMDSSGTVLCFNATRITCELKGLKPHTVYNISVMSYTRIGIGVISNFSVISDEHVPSLPPTDLSGYNISSSSIHISWKAIPAANHHGILRGYYINYSIKGSGIWEEMFVCPNQLSANLTELSAYREYEIRIAGLTSKGNGSMSDSAFIWTDQDTPYSPPITITGKNLSSTSLQLQWKPVPYEYARGIILGYKIIVLGYRLAYRNVFNDTSWNVTINDGNTLQHVFTSFEMYTDYTFQILAFTIKGEGNISEPVTVRTDEDSPFKPPSNVTLKSDVWHSVQVNWTSVPPEEIPGICRGYIVYYIRKEGSVDVLKNMIIPPTTVTVTIPYLSGFIIYGIWIAAFTYPPKIGPTANLTIKTEDWLPRIYPPDFSGIPISSTSLGISWKQIPLELTNGIMVGYVVEYVNTNKSIALNATFPTEQTHAVLTDLKKFNYYKLRIIAQNVNGFGNWSDYITLRTDEDTPEKSPKNATGSTASPTSLIVNWKPVPWDYRHGFIVGYTVFYRPISEAEEPLPYSTPKRIDVGPHVLELTIDNLSSFTEYSIEVLAQTVKGEGVKAAAITAKTCRCFEEMFANWRELAPYVKTNNSDGEPIGMMPRVIHSAIYECCRECPSHTTGRVRIDYTHDGYGNPANKSKDIIVKTYIDDKTDIHFPIFGFQDQTHFSKYYAYIPIVPSAGVAFFVNKDGGKASPQNVAAAVFSCWPLIMFNLIMAFLVGLIVWLLDSSHNPDHFHGSFIRGVASGFWFAFVTYTTVGYGDKTVVSIPARIFTVFWTLFGLVSFGIMMGAFSAALETMTYEETESPKILYGTKVAVLDNSSEHRLGLQKNSKVNTEQRYETLEDLKSAMLRSEVKGALIDAYVASYHKELFEHPKLRLNKIYDSNKAYGLVLAGPNKKIQNCVVHYLSENRAWVAAHVKANSRPYPSSKQSPAMQVADDMIDESSNVFLESLNSLIGLLVAAILIGLAYEVFRRWKNKKGGAEKYKIQPVISNEFREELNKLLLDLKENLANERKNLLKIIKQKK